MPKEIAFQREALLKFGSIPEIRLFRQNVGQGWQGRVVSSNPGSDGSQRTVTLADPRRIQFGLCPGSSDAIGIQSVQITPDHVGQLMAVFVAIEFKATKGRASAEQLAFLAMVNRLGGRAGLAKNFGDIENILRKTLA